MSIQLPFRKHPVLWRRFEQDYSGRRETLTQTPEDAHVHLDQDVQINRFHDRLQKRISVGGDRAKPHQPDPPPPKSFTGWFSLCARDRRAAGGAEPPPQPRRAGRREGGQAGGKGGWLGSASPGPSSRRCRRTGTPTVLHRCLPALGRAAETSPVGGGGGVGPKVPPKTHPRPGSRGGLSAAAIPATSPSGKLAAKSGCRPRRVRYVRGKGRPESDEGPCSPLAAGGPFAG